MSVLLASKEGLCSMESVILVLRLVKSSALPPQPHTLHLPFTLDINKGVRKLTSKNLLLNQRHFMDIVSLRIVTLT